MPTDHRLPLNTVMSAPFGFLGLRWNAQMLVTEIQYLEKAVPHQGDSHPIIKDLSAYFANPRAGLPPITASRGTAFQRRVWRAISMIPCGQAQTYGAVALQLGSGPRAVGGACRANPLPLIVPCHRVVAQNGLGGFAGALGGSGFYHEIKVWLLTHEGVLTSAQ